MVKKLASAFLIVVILGLVILGWLILPQLTIPKITDLKHVIPERVVFFAEIQDLKTVWNKIKATQLFALIKDLQGSTQEKKEDKFKKFLESEIVDALGKNCLIVTFNYNTQNIETDFPPILLVTRITAKTNIEKELLEVFLKTEDLKERRKRLKSQRHLGLNYKVVELDKETSLYYIVLRDTLVISNNPEIIKEVISVLKKKTPGLLNNKGFKAAYTKKSIDSAVFFYADFKASQEYFDSKAPKLEEFLELLKVYGLPELDYAVFQINITSGLHLSYNIAFDEERTTQELKDLWSGSKLRDFKLLKFFPRDAIIVGVNSGGENSSQFYKYTKNAVNEIKSVDLKQTILNRNKQFEDYFFKLGFDYEKDVLPLLKETGFAFFGLDPEAPALIFPFPSLCIIIRVSDKEKAESIILKVIESLEQEMPQNQTASSQETQESNIEETPISLVNEEIYKETKIKTLIPIIPILPFFSPSFCFLEDYLVLGINDMTVKKIIDIYKEKLRAFDANVTFMEFRDKLPEDLSSLFYLNTEDLAKQIMKLKNEKSEDNIVKTASDFLEQLGNIFGYAVTDSQHLEGDIFINIKGL